MRWSTVLLIACSGSLPGLGMAFRATPISVTRKTSFLAAPATSRPLSRHNKGSSTSLNMFMGSDGGLLGVGTPEVFTVLLVGYFVLGPSDLYKLVKEIGKFIQNIRTLGTDLTTTLESNMESQLQLEELRKAQRELNDAFSFRRSINTDENEEEAFSTTVTTPRAASTEPEEITLATDGTAKKKIRRRVRRKATTTADGTSAATAPPANGASIPDLEMPGTAPAEQSSGTMSTTDQNRPTDPFIEYTDEEMAKIDEDFDKYVSLDDDTLEEKEQSSQTDWFSEAEKPKVAAPAVAPADPQMEAAAQSRFQQQLSGNWNEQIMANEEKLEPLAKVMQLLASLEEEKMASTKRLEEEYRKRAEMEEEFYRKQRKALEEAAAQVQAAAASAQSPSSKA